ncbi:unnamed protein product [Prorocentrum cordatum]|uniref:Reverse transcriptase domain-containing protein n=1 Tax=Prorocentrum cordatum TaxID=2364126 RepID=A0ABN9WK63_9DINO|nr:unnamed protein product [Polarella glacialis]
MLLDVTSLRAVLHYQELCKDVLVLSAKVVLVSTWSDSAVWGHRLTDTCETIRRALANASGTAAHVREWLPAALSRAAAHGLPALRRADNDNGLAMHEWRPLQDAEGRWMGKAVIQLATEAEARLPHFDLSSCTKLYFLLSYLYFYMLYQTFAVEHRIFLLTPTLVYLLCAAHSMEIILDAKQHYADQIFEKRDFLGVVETHSNLGKVFGARAHPGYQLFWSHGTNRQAGVGFLMEDAFLRRFNPVAPTDWVEVDPGRAAKLSLRGPSGALDIFIVYMASGSDSAMRASRRATTSAISRHMAAPEQALMIMMGDCNFVVDRRDRWAKSSARWTGDADRSEADVFRTTLAQPFRLHELHQPLFTHECGLARSRLDRAYSNHSPADQLDRHFTCFALPATHLSAHWAIAFSRRSGADTSRKRPALTSRATSHPDFARRVVMEYRELLAHDTLDASPIRHLVLVKRAMHTVAASMRREEDEAQIEGTDDELGWILSFLRAAEQVNLTRMRRCAAVCPKIAGYVQPENPEARSSPGFWQLKDFAVQLARRSLTEEISELRRQQGHSSFDHFAHSKSNILTKLKRLLPGCSTTLAAMQGADGQVTDGATEMANALKTHWERVFQAPAVDFDILREWMASLRNDPASAPTQPVRDPLGRPRAPRGQLPREAWQRQVRKRDIEKAIPQAGNTSPSPDGIPFCAWKALKSFGVSTLLNVARPLESEDAAEAMRQAYGDECDGAGRSYNLGTLVCLPKAPTGEDPELGAFYHASDTRPPSVVNADNRLVASAMRWRWEEHLGAYVQDSDGDSAAVFLDFAAAFPSISQEYIQACLRHMGVPAVAAFLSLYNNSRCVVSVKGQIFDGFCMTSGARQGCPLSPLVYAVVAESLLDTVEARSEGIFARAYADDTALVVRDVWAEAPVLVSVFWDFEQISGLRLNKQKSFVIPLNAATYADLFGLHLTAQVYNTFALPTLGYISQLETPPEWVLTGAQRSLSRVAKGPGPWATAPDLWTLQEAFGLATSFKNLERMALAAKVRAVLFDGARAPRRQFLDDVVLHLREALARPGRDHSRAAWADWYGRAFLLCLAQAEDRVVWLAGSLESLRRSRATGHQRAEADATWRVDCQRTVYAFLMADSIRNPWNRFRVKFRRWQLGDAARRSRVDLREHKGADARMAKQTGCAAA